MPKKGRPADPLARALAEALDGLGTGCFSTDAEGRFLSVNATAAAMLGGSPAELCGALTLAAASADPQFWPRIRAHADRGDSLHALVSPTLRRGGAPFWAEWSLRRVEEGADGAPGFQGVLRDVTLQVEDARALRLTLDQLTEANGRLESFSRIQEELLSTLGHDLKTPPGIIMGFCELLLRGRYGETTSEQTRVLRAIHRNTSQLAQMLELLLEFSRFLKKAHTTPVTPYPLEPVLRKEVEALVARRGAGAVPFRLEPFPEGAATSVPPEVLSYLLHYLFDNLELLVHPEAHCHIGAVASPGRTRLRFALPRQQEERPPLNRLLTGIFAQPPAPIEGEAERPPQRLGLAAARYLALRVGAKLTVAAVGPEGVELTLSLPTDGFAPRDEASGG